MKLNYSSKLPIKDSFWSLLATVMPALLMIVSTGVVSRNLTNPEFVAYLYVLSFLVYLMFFDFGFSKAIVYFVSKAKDIKSKKSTITNVLFFGSMLSISLIALILLPIVIYYIPSVVELENKLIWPIYFSLVLVFFFSIQQQNLLCISEGEKNFFELAKFRIFSALITSIIPSITAQIWGEFFPLLIGLAISKISCCLVIFFLGNYSKFFDKTYINLCELKKIFQYSKGIYLSGLVAPFLGQGDRMIIASPNFVNNSAIYVPAVDLVSRLIMIPSALCKVIFVLAARSRNGLRDTFSLIIPYYILIMVMALLYLQYSSNILKLWLGPYADIEEMVTLSPIFTVGFISNALAQFHCSRLLSTTQGPLKVARIHLFELFLYACSAFYLVQTENIGVAAIAILWSGRMLLDYFMMVKQEFGFLKC